MQVSINSFTLLSYECGGVALPLICLIAVRVDIQLGQIRSLDLFGHMNKLLDWID